MSISVFGAGAFGTALAISLAKSGPVTLCARSEASARAMQSERKNARKLPGVVLEQSITVTSDPAEAAQSETILMAVPMQMLRGAVQSQRDLLVNQTLVACCKGIEIDSGLGPVAVLSQELPNRPVALLTGPSFARDIARGLPTALTLASESAEVGTRLQQALSQTNLRLYRTTDTVGAELGGALKNVIAIACGAVIGAGLGDSARAALMTRGYAEMQRLALVLGAQRETLAGLSGFGDLALTCMSEQSRNFRLGLSIGRGERFDPTLTVEGAATARAVNRLAAELSLDMPITQCVSGLIDESLTIGEAMAQLLARPLKEE